MQLKAQISEKPHAKFITEMT